MLHIWLWLIVRFIPFEATMMMAESAILPTAEFHACYKAWNFAANFDLTKKASLGPRLSGTFGHLLEHLFSKMAFRSI